MAKTLIKGVTKTLTISLILINSVNLVAMASENNDESKELENKIYNHLQNWDNSFSVSYDGDDIIDIVESASEKDDYLERSLDKFKLSKKGKEDIIEVTYMTTKDQEDYIELELNNVINEIITDSMSTADKVKAVNDYIVKKYSYDRNVESDNVYYALTTGIAACQGYSMTTYKMLKMMGIENRLVIGTMNGEGHAWNIVKIDNNWYNIDVTNNDDIIRDSYLLTSDQVLIENGFEWDRRKYPLANSNYYNTLTSYIDENNYKENSEVVNSEKKNEEQEIDTNNSSLSEENEYDKDKQQEKENNEIKEEETKATFIDYIVKIFRDIVNFIIYIIK